MNDKKNRERLFIKEVVAIFPDFPSGIINDSERPDRSRARGVRQLTGWDPARVGRLLEELDLDPALRPEVLSAQQFARLHGRLVDGGWTPG